MEQNKVNAIMMQYKDLIPAEQAYALKEALEKADDKAYDRLVAVPTKNPIVTLILSILAGGFGVDRFYLNDIGLGVAKLLLSFFLSFTGFFLIVPWLGMLIWPLVDIFLCYKKAKKMNFDALMRAITM